MQGFNIGAYSIIVIAFQVLVLWTQVFSLILIGPLLRLNVGGAITGDMIHDPTTGAIKQWFISENTLGICFNVALNSLLAPP